MSESYTAALRLLTKGPNLYDKVADKSLIYIYYSVTGGSEWL